MDSHAYEIDQPGYDYLKAASGEITNPLQDIMEHLLAADMRRFNQLLEEALAPQAQYLTETEYRIYRRGKKLRPMMLLLSARLAAGAGELSDKVIKASVSLEMLHVATLIHDDIIDRALLRRGLASVNATRGTNAAILVGDLQFVQAIRNFVDAIETEHEMGLVKLVLDTAFQICTGELDELATDKQASIIMLRQRYFDVIERKTAIMFGLACETGLALVDSRTSDARRLGFYGRRVGRAFQIMDDLFDLLRSEKSSGKQLGIDLEQGRLTLPIIYAMKSLGEAHELSKIMRGVHTSPFDPQSIIDAILETDSIERAYADARQEALDSLEYLKIFPANMYRDALESIAHFTVDRTF